MSDKNDPTNYKINDKDIETVLNILKKTDPKNATPEMAISLLEDMQAGVHQIAHQNPEKLEELLSQLQKSKKKKETT